MELIASVWRREPTMAWLMFVFSVPHLFGVVHNIVIARYYHQQQRVLLLKAVQTRNKPTLWITHISNMNCTNICCARPIATSQPIHTHKHFCTRSWYDGSQVATYSVCHLLLCGSICPMQNNENPLCHVYFVDETNLFAVQTRVWQSKIHRMCTTLFGPDVQNRCLAVTSRHCHIDTDHRHNRSIHSVPIGQHKYCVTRTPESSDYCYVKFVKNPIKTSANGKYNIDCTADNCFQKLFYPHIIRA